MNDQTDHRSVSEHHRFGRVLFLGCPNIGKSTLLNCLLGRPLSIVTRKKQTTRSSVTGILHREHLQLALVDCPGMDHTGKDLLALRMRQVIHQELERVDVVLLIALARGCDDSTKELLSLCKKAKKPVILALNKADLIRPRSLILKTVQAFSDLFDFAAIVPISALKKENIEILVEAIKGQTPMGEAQYPKDMHSERSDAFLIGESIRQQVFLLTRQEMPHTTTVFVTEIKEQKSRYKIKATIVTERPSQRAILLGKGGRTIEQIRKQAQRNIGAYFKRPIQLMLWIEVRSGWRNDPKTLNESGLDF